MVATTSLLSSWISMKILSVIPIKDRLEKSILLWWQVEKIYFFSPTFYFRMFYSEVYYMTRCSAAWNLIFLILFWTCFILVVLSMPFLQGLVHIFSEESYNQWWVCTLTVNVHWGMNLSHIYFNSFILHFIPTFTWLSHILDHEDSVFSRLKVLRLLLRLKYEMRIIRS